MRFHSGSTKDPNENNQAKYTMLSAYNLRNVLSAIPDLELYSKLLIEKLLLRYWHLRRLHVYALCLQSAINICTVWSLYRYGTGFLCRRHFQCDLVRPKASIAIQIRIEIYFTISNHMQTHLKCFRPPTKSMQAKTQATNTEKK